MQNIFSHTFLIKLQNNKMIEFARFKKLSFIIILQLKITVERINGKGGIKMERVVFELTAQEKKNLKIKALEQNKTLTQFLRDKLDLSQTTSTQTAKERITEINELLQKNGANMTADERNALKFEREQLKKEVNKNEYQHQ